MQAAVVVILKAKKVLNHTLKSNEEFIINSTAQCRDIAALLQLEIQARKGNSVHTTTHSKFSDMRKKTPVY